jgi:GntR family transcriptional repressor for pyruvate dehydrogenase complex
MGATEQSTVPDGIELRPVGQRRTFEEILDQLEENIAAGRLSAGDRLPAERELASRLGVSRPSVREALRVLEALGIVQVQRGADRGAALLEEPGNAFAHLLRLHLALSHVSIESIVEFLIMIQSWAARAVARDASPGALAELEVIVTAMQDPTVAPATFYELDAAFHARLVGVCQNEIITLVFEGCIESLRRLITQVVLGAPDWPVMRAELAEEHYDIFRALTSGDIRLAESAIREHLTVWCHRAIALQRSVSGDLPAGDRLEDEHAEKGASADTRVDDLADFRSLIRF